MVLYLIVFQTSKGGFYFKKKFNFFSTRSTDSRSNMINADNIVMINIDIVFFIILSNGVSKLVLIF